jgi:hypothetical protein
MGYAWHGSSGYSIAGMFDYQDYGQHVVTENDLTSFVFEAFHNGSSMGGFNGAGYISTFLYENGADYVSTLWQNWNYGGASMGFGCAVGFCALTENGQYIAASKTGWGLFVKPSHIAAEPKPGTVALPEPATLGLLLAGLAAFGLRRRVRD